MSSEKDKSSGIPLKGHYTTDLSGGNLGKIVRKGFEGSLENS